MTVAVIIATGRACGGSGPLSAAALPYGGGPGGGPEPVARRRSWRGSAIS